MSDLIDRKAATQTVLEFIVEYLGGAFDEDLQKKLMERMNAIPSAQPNRKKGKCIYDGDCYICDQCKSVFGWWVDSQTSNYCPNCGSDNRG